MATTRHPKSLTRTAVTTLGRSLPAAISILIATNALAAAGPLVNLQTALQPLRLGRSTNISTSFQLATRGGSIPPLSAFSVQLPAGMGLASTTLGVATCSATVLDIHGASSCPRDSVMGSGSAEVAAPFGTQTVFELARLTIFMTRLTKGHTTMLFYVDGRSPVLAQLLFNTQLLAAPNRLDSELYSEIPPIATAPGDGDVAIVRLRSNIGPRGLTYLERAHGRTVSYIPTGLTVPEHCPRGGFVFVADFDFLGGQTASARSVVGCPSGSQRRGGQREDSEAQHA